MPRVAASTASSLAAYSETLDQLVSSEPCEKHPLSSRALTGDYSYPRSRHADGIGKQFDDRGVRRPVHSGGADPDANRVRLNRSDRVHAGLGSRRDDEHGTVRAIRDESVG
ncbi:MAG: hypothetical protein QOF01_1316 [Thermomicrobiales bacterium]|nr:hypothetical protein [Thermomicrobiales bacterium]